MIFVLSLSYGQTNARYTQSAPEIEAVKGGEAAYNAGNWDQLLSLYADDATIGHNGTTIGPKGAIAWYQGTADATSFYQLQYEHDEFERVVTDKGETWVNAWGTLQFVFPGRTDTLTLPLHVTYEFNAAGKVAREFAFYDNTKITNTQAAARYGADELIFIREDQIKEGHEETFTKAWQQWRDILDEKQAPLLYWMSAMREDNIAYHNYNIKSLSDFKQIKASLPTVWNAATETMGEEVMAKWGEQVNGARKEYREYVVRRVSDLSYWPSAPNGMNGAEIGHFNMYELEFEFDQYDDHIALIKEINALAREVNTPVPFNYFEYVLGGSATKAIVVEYAKDKADYDRRHAEEEKLFDTEKGRSLYQRMETLYRSMKQVPGKTMPEISRPQPGE